MKVRRVLKDGRSRRRSPAAMVLSAACWLAVAPLVPPVLSPLFAGSHRAIDLCSNFIAQWLLATLAVLALVGLVRRWRPALLAAAVCLGHAGWLTLGAPRVAGAGGALSRDDSALRVRVLHYNAHTYNKTPEVALRLIMESGADVVGLTEPPDELLDMIRDSAEVSEKYPHFFLPDRARGGYRVILSVWPAEFVKPGESPSGEATELAGGMRLARIDAPAGAFWMVIVHPESPRYDERWGEGVATAKRAVRVINEMILPDGLPVIATADMNSSPTGHVSRLLVGGTGLKRAKPRLVFTGTWPGNQRWPAQIAIDDVLASPQWRRVSWERLGTGGSDHHAVLVELAIPR